MAEVDTYNIFRRKHEPALSCAVRQDWPVPDFVSGAGWAYVGIIKTSDPVPAGFKPKAARDAMVCTGYYLFHLLKA